MIDPLTLIALSKANKGSGGGKVYTFTSGMQTILLSSIQNLISSAYTSGSAYKEITTTTWSDDDNEIIKSISNDVSQGKNAILAMNLDESATQYITIQHVANGEPNYGISFIIPIYPSFYGPYLLSAFIVAYKTEGVWGNQTFLYVQKLDVGED